jgi:hypothetical protein
MLQLFIDVIYIYVYVYVCHVILPFWLPESSWIYFLVIWVWKHMWDSKWYILHIWESPIITNIIISVVSYRPNVQYLVITSP